MAEVGSTANRYQILAKLAAGGMAEIFLAHGASVGGVERYCVLKRILREHAKDAQFVQMFVDEARLAAQLQHPNIASVYDIGMLGDSYFFTMEYVHGETIRSLLDRAQEVRRPVPLACVLTIIAGAASGLHHAHERHAHDGRPLGIVHRDVSPANLMVSYEGNVKLVDFGVAKAAGRAVETRSGTVKGKISYLSPEQCRAVRVDRRSDLFSLGIVMWEMLTGARLYRRDSDFHNMTAIVNEPPPAPSVSRPEVPRAIDEIALRLLAKSVTERFQTAAEVVEAIENASIKARTILSTSAVSRLVRDLFGPRAEPWLELEGETRPFEPLAVASRPIPKELGRAPTDAVALDLAGVLDLSSWSTLDERDDPVEPHEVKPPAARSARAAVPVAAPSPASAPIAVPARPVARHPRAPSSTAAPFAAAAPTTEPAAPSAPIEAAALTARPSQPTLPLASPASSAIPWAPPAPPMEDAPESPSAWHTTLLDATPPTPWSTTLAEAAPSNPSNTTLLGVSAPPSSTTSARLSPFPIPAWVPAQIGPPVIVATPRAGNPVVAARAATSGEPMMTPGSSRYLPAYANPSQAPPQMRRSTPPPARISWLLVAVIVLAAAVGVVAIWVAMRTYEGRARDIANVVPAQLPVTNSELLDASNPPPGVPPGTAVVADTIDASASQEATVAPAKEARSPTAPEAVLDAGASPSDAPLPAPASPPRHVPDGASPPLRMLADPGRPARATASEPPDGSPAVPRDVSPSPPTPNTSPPQPAPVEAASSAPASKAPAPASKAPAPPRTAEPSLDALRALFENTDYAGVVRACTKTTVTTAIAGVCTLAACYVHDAARAQRWLFAAPAKVREKLVARCKQLGNTALKV